MCEFFKEGRLIGMGGSILNCQGIHVSNKLIQFFDVFFGQADDSDTYILIADEPTTALDVTIQAQILSMICDLQRKYGTSVIMITHDLGVVAETCDKVGIIYAGETVEYGSLEDIFTGEKHHPYTKGLFGSIPNLEDNERRLHPIEGLMPDPTKLPDGCAFADRCKQACEVCHHKKPDVFKEGGHSIHCHLYTGEIADRKEQES